MTIAVTDGVSLYAVRYSSNGKSPTLYYSPEVDEIYKMNPKIRGSFGATARAVVSEPIGAFPQIWTPVPEATMLSIRNGDLVAQAFQPRQPE